MRKSLPVLALIGVIGALGAWYWYGWQETSLPAGLVSANGRTEAGRIDISAKSSGRLDEVLAREGDMVEAGAVVAVMDAAEVDARLREAEAVVRQTEEGLNEAHALLAQRESERVYAERELNRAEQLAERGYTPAETVDLRRAQHKTAVAAVASAKAGIARANASIEAAKATVERIAADRDDHFLRAPRAGRVQYRLAEPGEIVAAGGRVLSLLDLTDVYMTVYLPTDAAGRLRFGAEARLVFDAAPDYVVPASVTYVASEAQFTPRYVETASEREKLMFRVKVTLPPDVLERHRDVVKTGVPGVAYIRLDPSVPWPESLAVRLPDVR
ncbi:HlyD family efflux transporter periplasmic adaptor subunit [Thalassobaculum sp. OXR-137]|uniref:HlyD family secretion protein n=1 Tax=Thalassobaculum sp. OXR-137 TaxID=3100173 RepID=UPI002AC93C6C|nr:HlyD family efflux transporter periplasmic adaptor subunit [Thalassobaculum sp. OXR-137]WPZ34029.1 HlyD family efflux transporter periplasmic adaptor subunit [Thalassobaculum sp. OXR-137]